jgi:hypothetical protein
MGESHTGTPLQVLPLPTASYSFYLLLYIAEEYTHYVANATTPGTFIQVSFHRYYYGLGEHYNSVVPIS